MDRDSTRGLWRMSLFVNLPLIGAGFCSSAGAGSDVCGARTSGAALFPAVERRGQRDTVHATDPFAHHTASSRTANIVSRG
ncbi:hypothetical protein SMICM17S_08680 [Streptomyces microflavus]